ncbi:hypothetical protein F5Y04DRAFT_28965 [Hypomontagnella monticulosa]|nr:hypothetical protein F5Y04DRAFT_28965 [Hypomontagnella monticulosa]
MANQTDDGSRSEANSLPPSLTRRACESCRIRKIRCDKNSPCSNCQRAKIECRVTPRAPHQKRARVLISSQYERKIDQLDQKLEQVIHMVERLGSQGGSPSTSKLTMPNSGGQAAQLSDDDSVDSTQSVADDDLVPSHQSKPGSLLPEGSLGATPPQESRSLIQGESSLSAQSSFANKFLSSSIGSDQGCTLGYELNEELTKLDQIVDLFKHALLSQELACRHALPTPPTRRNDYKLPPIEAAVAIIRKSQGDFWSNGFQYLLSSDSLSDLCLKVYFSDQYTEAEFIILNAALLHFYLDLDSNDTDESSSEEQDRDKNSLPFLCRRNLETAISRLSLFPPANHDTVLALVMSAAYAIDTSKPSLAWRLTSAASNISCMLGFHTRSEGTEKSSGVLNKHGRLFWILYLLEKHLSLRLGYSSTIQDRDITVPFPTGSHVPATYAMQYWHELVKLASIAGRIYEELYSPQALCLSAEERSSHAMKLAQETEQNRIESQYTNELWLQSVGENPAKREIKYICLSDDVLRQSMITLIHRAVPPPHGSGMAFTEECINSSRLSLQSHDACIAAIANNPRYLSVYFQWTILFVPFVPFIVLFCYVVETGDTSDLARMQSVVASTRAAGEKSASVAKLHLLFEAFYTVARRYTDVRSAANTPRQDEQIRLHSCLLELGLQAEAGQVANRSMDETANGQQLISPSSIMGLAGQIIGNGTVDWTNQDLPLESWVPLNQHMNIPDNNRL